jgi:hypothetical protein
VPQRRHCHGGQSDDADEQCVGHARVGLCGALLARGRRRGSPALTRRLDSAGLGDSNVRLEETLLMCPINAGNLTDLLARGINRAEVCAAGAAKPVARPGRLTKGPPRGPSADAGRCAHRHARGHADFFPARLPGLHRGHLGVSTVGVLPRGVAAEWPSPFADSPRLHVCL